MEFIINKNMIYPYLNMKIKRTSNEKKMATLSMVRSITNNCLLSCGMNRTNFRILNKRNVLNTERPDPCPAPSDDESSGTFGSLIPW